MTQVWKVPIKSGRGDFTPERVARARDYCFARGWVGLGWEIDCLPDRLRDPRQYERAINKWIRPEDRRSAKSAHIAIAHTMTNGDFVWCRAHGDTYWLGRVCGSWTYRCARDFDDLDLYQVRKCRWIGVGPADDVPGPVKNAFAGRGGAISRLRAEHDAALLQSAQIWYQRTGEQVPDLPPANAALRLSALGHDDLEDLVVLYLQVAHGWLVVPSTAKRSTPYTECVLRKANGERAYVQVKAGATPVEFGPGLPHEVDRIYLFDLVTPAELRQGGGATWISVEDIEVFAGQHANMLPARLQNAAE